MRIAMLVALGGLLLCGTAHGQGFKKDKAPAKGDTQATKIAGRTLEQWIKDIHNTDIKVLPDASRSENALRTILLFGPDRAYKALPSIFAELQRNRPPSNKIDTSVRVNAAIALGVILGGANDPGAANIREGVTHLTRLLGDSQQIVIYRATEALGRIGHPAKSAKANLLAQINFPHTWEVRQATATALSNIYFDKDGKNPPPTDVLSALNGRLKDSSYQVRLAALQALTVLGGKADEKVRAQLISYLGTPLGDREATLRVWAHMAIMSLQNKISEKEVAAIAGLLKHKDLATRMQAARSLGMIAQNDKGEINKDVTLQINHLIAALDDIEPDGTIAVMWALSRLKKSGGKAVPALQKLMADHKEQAEVLKKSGEELEKTPEETKLREKGAPPSASLQRIAGEMHQHEVMWRAADVAINVILGKKPAENKQKAAQK